MLTNELNYYKLITHVERKASASHQIGLNQLVNGY